MAKTLDYSYTQRINQISIPDQDLLPTSLCVKRQFPTRPIEQSLIGVAEGVPDQFSIPYAFQLAKNHCNFRVIPMISIYKIQKDEMIESIIVIATSLLYSVDLIPK